MHSFRPVTEITQFADILYPEDSEPPILSPEIRAAVRQWMLELSSEKELKDYGLKPRRTALLSGPPGCGKTTLAHHFSARLGLPLVVVNMAALTSMYVGETGRNVNKLFDAVKDQSNSCVLFLDEFDSMGATRDSGTEGSSKEKNSIVISLLQKIDTFPGIMIAATNRGDDIDSAIWRRFGMQIEIKEPDDESRFAILSRYLLPLVLADNAIDLLSEVTAGASPAVLRQLMEGIKRDLILAPRYDQELDIVSVFKRIIISVKPHTDSTIPALWKEAWPLESIKNIAWPPADSRKPAEAA